MSPEFLTGPFDPSHVLDAVRFPDQPWAQALDRGDLDAAAHAYVAQLRTGSARYEQASSVPAVYQRRDGREMGRQADGHDLVPDEVIQLRYTGCYGITHQFQGETDWWFDPTADWGDRRTVEWQVQLNRHYQWVPLANAYRDTGNPKYARHWERELRSWTRQCPRPPRLNMQLPGTWRTIEVGIRAGWTWPWAFEGFRSSPEVSDEALWIFVCMMREHACYLLQNPWRRNFKAMEANGLAHAGTMFYEMTDSYTFASVAGDRCIAEIERQFYPDGTQDELAPNYAVVSISNIYAALRMLEHYASVPAHVGPGPVEGLAIPWHTWDRFITMLEALGAVAMPDGIATDLHDCGRLHVPSILDAYAAQLDHPRLHDPIWRRDALTHLPWGGYTVSNRLDTWCLLDAGPFGTGHQHHDALQLVTWAYGKPLCIDPGKPIYNRSAITQLIRSSEGHNVMMLDGQRHHEEPLVHRARSPFPVTRSEVDGLRLISARREFETFDDSPARFHATRTVLDLGDGAGWLVLDRLQPADTLPHTWRWNWHLAAEMSATAGDGDDAGSAHASYGPSGPGLRIHTAAPVPHRSAAVRGRTEPTPLGWQIRNTSVETPIPVVVVETDAQAGDLYVATWLHPLQAGDTGAGDSLTRVDGKGDPAITLTLGTAAAPRGYTILVGRDTLTVQRPSRPAVSFTIE